MPLDFSSGGTPVNTGVLDFSRQGTPVGGKPKRTPQQVMQEVAAAQASRDVVNPPETQGLLGQIAASPITGGIVNVASLRPVMTGIGQVASFIGNTIANDLNFTGEQQPKPFVIDTDNGTISQEPGVQQPFGAGRSMVQVPLADPQARMGIRDVSALPQVLGQLVEGLSTPENVATLPLAAGKSVGGQVAATLFAPQMISGGVESGMQALDSQLDPRAREEAAYNAAINLLLGGKIGKGLLDARPWTPEVLPPLQRPVAPAGRQLPAPEQPYIDAEVVVPPRLPAPGERPTMPVGSPLDRPAGAARFGVDPTGKAVDISQLSPKEQVELYRGPKEYVPREQYVRPSQGPIPIIGEQKMMPNPLPNVVEPLVPFQNETRPLKREFVPSKLPVEPSGGEVSFRAPAQAQGVPSARQSALPQAEMPKREVVFQNETAPLPSTLPPENPAYRAPKAAPTLEEYQRQQRRANVEQGLTMEQPPTEPLPQEVGQYPEPMQSGRALSKLQRERLKLAIDQGKPVEVIQNILRVGQEKNPPQAPPAKPTVAKLSTSGNKNPIGDPMGSTYYATPEDWGAWQKVQTDFKDLLSKGAEFDGPEMMKVRQENENIKNRYGGMPPVEPKSGGIGGGIKGAVEKNKEAGSVENPFGPRKPKKLSYEEESKLISFYDQFSAKIEERARAMAKVGADWFKKAELKVGDIMYTKSGTPIKIVDGYVRFPGRVEKGKGTVNDFSKPMVYAEQVGPYKGNDENVGGRGNFYLDDLTYDRPVIKGDEQKKPNTGDKGRLYINPIGPIVKQTAKDVATLGKKVKEVGTDFIRAYSEPLQEQMGRLGGPVGKMVSEEAGQIVSRGKELYGELTPVIDPAKKQVGKMMRGGTTWMRGRNEVTPYASFNNFFGVNEGVGTIPTEARRGMKLAADANLAIGKMAERANPGFKASGKLQRIPTTVGYDFIVNGGEGRNRWIEGVAKLNNKPITEVENFFNKMKETLGDPSSDAASLDRINQDFTRKFPRTITHIKTATGWHEVVVSDPFNYLEQAAQRTAHSVAFREVYPLIEHNGQWVQSGKLQATRKAIMKELDKGSDIVKFDNLVKALQGHPLDTFKGGATTAIGAVSGTIGSPLKALMLSANAPVNIGEVLSGGPSIFMGYTTMGKAVAKMLTDNTFYDQLELTGARNKAMYNMALDPSSPLRSVARQVATGVRALTGQQFLNEIQEATAAASAKVYSDAIKGGQMSKYSLNRAKALFRAMGFNEGQASKMVKGDVELLKQFENRAASWLTTGNQSTAEMSRLGASRLFNAAFWFHKYPQMTLNQFRSVGGNWINDVHAYAKKPTKENWSPLYHNSVLMGRLLGGRSLQGAITLGILAGVSGGIYGIYQTMREAEEDSLKFAGDSLVSGFGGPLSVMQRLNQNVKGGESFTKELVKLSAPASINQDLIDMGMGVGRYAGMSKMESISTFLESKTPISRTIRMGLAVGGLAEKDLELEVAMKAFYKWRKEQPGFVLMGQMGGTEDQIEIRSGMQKVKKAIESGEDWVAELKKVKDTKGAGASLRAGTMLQLNGKPLDTEQMKSLEKRLGANGLEKIKLRDAMVREVGRELNEKKESGEKQAPEEIKKPTGKWAVDYETDSVRSERVMGRLEPKVQEFLKQNGVEDVGYTPALKRGLKRQQLTVEQAKVLEDELVVQLDKMVGTLAKNKNLESQTPKLRQTLISNMLEGARKIAMAKSLGKIPQDPEQQRK